MNPLSHGRCVVATVRSHLASVHKAIRKFGPDLQVTFNRESVMVLPSGVNKGTGLTAALADLHMEGDRAVGIGDAENDHAFLSLCRFSVAVANAIPSLKDRVHLVTAGSYGAGVVEVIQKLVATDQLP